MRKFAILLIMVIAVAALVILPGGSAKQIHLTDNNPDQAPLQMDNSGGQIQAGGVNPQNSIPTTSATSPQSSGQASVQSGSASSTPAQPSDTPTPSPNYPPCYYCSPANHHVCPERASFYPCYCGSTLYTNDAIACMAQ